MDSQLLKSLIMRYDGTQLKLSEAMGLSLSRLNAKINETGGAEFRQGEIGFIRDRYQLTDAEVEQIFFKRKVS